MDNKTYSAKAVVEAGLMTALVVVIFLMNSYVPLFGYIGLFILPIPITILYTRYDFKIALTAVFGSAILIAMTGSVVSAIGSVALYGSTAMVMGYCIKNKKSSTITLLSSVGAMIFGIAIDAIVMIYGLLNTTLNGAAEKLVDMFQQSLDTMVSIYNAMGVDMTQMQTSIDLIKNLDARTILLLIPSILVLSGFMQGYINYIITRKIMKRIKYDMPKLRPFDQWYVDNRIGALLIISVLLGYLLSSNGMAPGDYISITAMYILRFTATIIGVAVIYSWLAKKGMGNKVLLIFLFIFSLLSPFISQVVFMFGLMDFIFDFRKLDPNSLGTAIQAKLENKLKK